MDASNKNRTEYGFWLDLGFLTRLIRKWMFAILCMAIVAGVIGYVVSDLVLHDTYTASAVVSVVPKENTKGLQSVNSMKSAVTRNMSMWNSSTLLKLIKDENPSILVDGALKATTISESNLIRITSTAKSAEDAYMILRTATREYHRIDSNFDTSYQAIVLTRVQGNNIATTHKKPWLFGAAGFLAAICGCLILLGLWSALTDVLHEEEQAKQLLDIPVFESLPYVDKKKKKIKAILLTQQKLDLDYLNAMDKLTARVEQHLHHKNQKFLMVSSVQENEGKSTVAVNLALNLARRGGKTLLIDMDFRRPVLYKIFDHVKEETGSVSTALQENQSLTVLAEHRPDLYGLDILWQFKPVHDSDRFIEKLGLRGTLEELSKHYDYIVIDTPPVGPVRDTEVLSREIDNTLLVVRQDFIRASVVNDVIDQLEENGTLCMGAVVNTCRNYRRIGRNSRKSTQPAVERRGA